MPPPSRRSTARRKPGVPSSYDWIVNTQEPTVLWRLFHPDGGHARAVLLPGGPPTTLTFFVNEVMDRAENFDSMDVALFRSDAIRQSMLGDGWKED